MDERTAPSEIQSRDIRYEFDRQENARRNTRQIGIGSLERRECELRKSDQSIVPGTHWAMHDDGITSISVHDDWHSATHSEYIDPLAWLH